MQFFDAATLLLCAGLLVFSFTIAQKRAGLCLVLASLVLLTLFAHLIFEGYRWQMVPCYLVLVCLLIVLARNYRHRHHKEEPKVSTFARKAVRWLGITCAAILLSLSGLLSHAFPVFEMLSPSGAFSVGTTELHLIDESRDETYSEDSSDNRELMLRVWYPTESTPDDSRARYWQDAAERSKAVTSRTPLPWFTFTHLDRVKTNSYWDVPISREQQNYPVVLYSHGIGIGWASANSNLAEGLASNGYIVLGINHTYIGSVSIFPDGRVLGHHQATANAMSTPPPAEVGTLQAKMISSRDWREQVALYEQAMSLMPADALTAVGRALSVQVADQKFVLDRLTALQQTGSLSLAKHFDLERIGILGMSLGGSAALETCSEDKRCKAGVNLDGFHPRHIGLELHDTPFLFLNRDDNLLFNTNFQSSTAAVDSVLIAEATHFNFFDFSIMSPLYKRMGVLGSIEGHRMLEIIEASSLAFFNKHLKRVPNTEWQATTEDYPEVIFSSRNQK